MSNITKAELIEGYMTVHELEWLSRQAELHKDIVEIGSYLGRSTRALADNTSGNVFAFDNWKGLQENHLPVDTRKGLFNIFKSNMNGLLETGKVLPLLTDHRDYDKMLKYLESFGVVPDMVFIDGCHEYGSVKDDISFWMKHIQKGGLICGHNLNWEGVNTAVRELLPNYKQVGITSLWSYIVDDTNVEHTKRINDGITASYNKTVGLMMAIPFVGRPVTPEWAISFAQLNYPMNMNRTLMVIGGEVSDKARELAAERSLEVNADYLFFLDDDVQVPTNTVRQLIYRLEQADDDVMIAAGVYVTKDKFCEPIMYKGDSRGAFWKWKQGDIVEVDGVGTGCMMIRTKVLKELSRPWFKVIDNIPDGGMEVAHYVTEDLYFCKKVRSAGFKIIVDTDILCGHWDVKTMKRYDLRDDSHPLQK